MNAKHARLLRVAMSAALLLVAWRLVDGDELLRLLRTMDMQRLIVAVALTIPMHILSAVRWQFTCTRIGVELSLRDALREYYLASLLNTVLPGGVTGDAARVWRQSDQGHHPGRQDTRESTRGLRRFQRPAHGVIVERFAGQCALFAVLAFGIAINHQRLAPALDGLIAMLMLVALVVVGGWVLISSEANAATTAPRWRRAAHELHADALRALTPWPVSLIQALLSLSVVACYLAIFWAAAQAVHAPIDLVSALFAFPLVLTAMTLPVSVGGLGLRETTAAVLWPVLSLSAHDGAASALTYGVVILIGALPGVIVALQQRKPSMHR